jgi:hypothetical protein
MDWAGWVGLGIGIVVVGLGVFASAKDYKRLWVRRRLIRTAIFLVVIGGVMIGYGIVRKVETERPPSGEGNEGWQEMGQKEVRYYLNKKTCLNDVRSEGATGDAMRVVVRKTKNRIVAVVADGITRGGGTGIATRALLSSEMLRFLSQRGVDRD